MGRSVGSTAKIGRKCVASVHPMGSRSAFASVGGNRGNWLMIKQVSLGSLALSIEPNSKKRGIESELVTP